MAEFIKTSMNMIPQSEREKMNLAGGFNPLIGPIRMAERIKKIDRKDQTA